jgi:hypothetical protein
MAKFGGAEVQRWFGIVDELTPDGRAALKLVQ